MKKLLIGSILLLLVSSLFGQSLNNRTSGVQYPINITPMAIIEGRTGDTLQWFWNSAQVRAYVALFGFGSGTVTSVTSGSLTPIFTSSVATSTTTPAITYTLTAAGSYTVLTNSTNAIAAPSYQKLVPSALYSTSGTASSSTFYRGDGQWQTPTPSTDSAIYATRNYVQNGFIATSSTAGGALSGTYPNPDIDLANGKILIGGVGGVGIQRSVSGPILISNTGVTSISSTAAATTQSPGDNSTRIATTAYVDAAGLTYTTVSLTSAMLLSLNTTPVTVIASPGAGKAIKVIGIIWDYTYGTSTYSLNGGIPSLYLGGVVYKYLNTFSLTNTSSIFSDISLNITTNGTGNTSVFSTMTEGALTLSASANPTTGDGTAKITIISVVVTR